jgi:hypothetical protein
MPLCPDQPNENSPANTKAEAARATFVKFCFMGFSPLFKERESDASGFVSA